MIDGTNSISSRKPLTAISFDRSSDIGEAFQHKPDPNGWVHCADGLLFWVPEDCRLGLPCRALLTIPNTGRDRAVRLDLTRFRYGTLWTGIRGNPAGQ